MAIYNKPDENVFASSARQGEVSNFPDIGRGWGISFDQTGGIPPMEWFNFLFKRTDEKFGYLFQRGLSEWSATQSYPDGALVQYKNLTYKAKRANTNKKPDEAQSSDWQRWGFAQSELGVATLTESGITQLLTSTNSDDETKSATPKSVKIAYDKGVEAKTAADNANNNANGRVSKSGDEMTGGLAITGSQSGGFTSGLKLKNKAYGQNTGVSVSFYQTHDIPRASILMKEETNKSTQIEFLNTPDGADLNIDSRQTVFTIASSGNLWSETYGWLHDKFASKSDVYAKSRFRHKSYRSHYDGAEVFDVPMSDNGVMRTIIMSATIDGYARLNLPESFNGFCKVQVTDVGSGRHVIGANIKNGNVVELFNSGRTGINIIAIGWYGW